MVVWLSDRCNSILEDRSRTEMLTIWNDKTFYSQEWCAKLEMDGRNLWWCRLDWLVYPIRPYHYWIRFLIVFKWLDE